MLAGLLLLQTRCNWLHMACLRGLSNGEASRPVLSCASGC